MKRDLPAALLAAFLIGLGVLASMVVVITIFGDEIKAEFGMSANVTCGDVAPTTRAPRHP